MCQNPDSKILKPLENYSERTACCQDDEVDQNNTSLNDVFSSVKIRFFNLTFLQSMIYAGYKAEHNE